ncbi:unnamed protein product [Urochloa decumbens]|uniref:MATH domain-containing protein n=1 Tax=Urochloa decumbens TaxID=240449 RepID=A0ABC9C3J9_9POAL
MRSLLSALPAFLRGRTANLSNLQRRLPPSLRAALSTTTSSPATAAGFPYPSSRTPAAAPPPAPTPTTTASSCTPETARGRHVFKVAGYSLLKGLGAGKFVRSATFSVGGHDWCVRYFPDGDRCDDCGAVFLALMTKGVEVRALFDIRLVNLVTGGLSRPLSLDRPRLFSDAAGSFGHQMFQKRMYLEASEYLRDDCLVIHCDVTVIKGLPVPRSEAMEDIIQALPYGSIQEQPYGSIQEPPSVEILPAPPCGIQQALPSDLKAPSSDIQGPPYDIQVPPSQVLLHFVYTDSLLAEDDLKADGRRKRVEGLLEAADTFGLDRLKLMCESILCKKLSVDNVADTLDLANWHYCKLLKDASCIGFIISPGRMDDVVATEGYKRLKEAFPNVVKEILDKASKSAKVQ